MSDTFEKPLVENPLFDLDGPLHDIETLATVLWGYQSIKIGPEALPDEVVWLIAEIGSRARKLRRLFDERCGTFSEQTKAANVVTFRLDGKT